jgi:hypothetical protein
MFAGLRTGFRTTFLCLLSVAASLAAAASVPSKASPAPAARTASAAQSTAPRDNPAALLPAAPSHPQACGDAELTAPSNSLTHRVSRRIFVEDTTPPSSEVLTAARVQTPLRSDAPPRATSPALRNNTASVANRQRAP